MEEGEAGWFANGDFLRLFLGDGQLLKLEGRQSVCLQIECLIDLALERNLAIGVADQPSVDTDEHFAPFLKCRAQQANIGQQHPTGIFLIQAIGCFIRVEQELIVILVSRI